MSKRTFLIDLQDFSLKCLICNASFDAIENFEIHECRNSEENHFNCSLCQESFSSASNLNLHNLIHGTTGTLYQCQKCKVYFNYLLEFEKHVKDHTQKNTENEETVITYECVKSSVKPSDLTDKRVSDKSNLKTSKG